MLLRVKHEVSTELQTKMKFSGMFTEVNSEFKHTDWWALAGSVLLNHPQTLGTRSSHCSWEEEELGIFPMEVSCLVLWMPGVCEHAQIHHYCKLWCSSEVQVLHLRGWGAICTEIAMLWHAAGFHPILRQDRTRSICFSEGITFLHWNLCQIKICWKLSDLPMPALFPAFS